MYENGYTTPMRNAAPQLDRCRGGTLQITLQIPSETIEVENGRNPKGDPVSGTVTTDAMSVTFAIDIEQLPLVDVARYKIEEEQVAPDNIPYPNGTKTYSKTFS